MESAPVNDRFCPFEDRVNQVGNLLGRILEVRVLNDRYGACRIRNRFSDGAAFAGRSVVVKDRDPIAVSSQDLRRGIAAPVVDNNYLRVNRQSKKSVDNLPDRVRLVEGRDDNRDRCGGARDRGLGHRCCEDTAVMSWRVLDDWHWAGRGNLRCMRAQEHLVLLTTDAIDDLFRNAAALPEAQLTWSPMDQGRSALDQLQEVAQAPLWVIKGLEDGNLDFMSRSYFVESLKLRREWTTLGECERICRFNTALLCEKILALPDARLDELIKVPFRGGLEEKIGKFAARHYLNAVYHLGQIAYIQTLLGDKAMH